MATKPSIPKGTRDFMPQEMAKRNYIFNTIREVYELYGFRQIETPALENLSTLMGKYGDEGDKLLFKILNSGNFLNGVSQEDFNSESVGKLAARICEKGLRYDLTVPFARFVVQHRDDIKMPFRRYRRCGEPTARRKEGIASFTSAMPMWWEATRCSTRWNWLKS